MMKNESTQKDKFNNIKEEEDVTLPNEQSDYHYSFLQRYSVELKKDLLNWYYKYRRKLPWRGDEPPFTTSVQLYENKKQVDIRCFFGNHKRDEIKIKNSKSDNVKNNEKIKGTKIMKIKKEHNELSLERCKRLKKEDKDEEKKYNSLSDSLKSENIKSLHDKINNNNNNNNDDDVVDKNNCNSSLLVHKEEKKHNFINNLMYDKEHLSTKGYQIYISEIMLQQTKVHTVLNFYLKWMNKWNNIFDLAKCNLDDVLILWKGLGYYNRAKNLLECCKIVVDKYNGIFPNDLKLLKTLPGIGDYTSKAICIHLYNRKDICIDTNIIRIFSRITDTINYYNSGTLLKHCEKVSEILCSGESNYSDLSQAFMDLGSSVCNNSPDCSQCPINKYCMIYLKSNKKKQHNLFNTKHPEHCNLCVNDRNVEIKYVPLAKRKKKTDKICLVLLIKQNDKKKKNNMNKNSCTKKLEKKKTASRQIKESYLEDTYMMIKNTDTNLFSMHYLFPFILLDTYDKNDCVKHFNDLLKSLNVTNSEKDRYLYINNFKHKFSHLTYHTHIYLCTVSDWENITKNNEERKWVILKDIRNFTHNTFCQNIIDSYKKSMNEKINGLSEYCI
ncbi:A/G-specific adenine glycosylase [Plasmodium falciparum 7G8]|uniref:A/G-specific adenine glycosylase n=3 Tax=Plasmodium falciparum TaxID=5833 RepID=A0A024X643_PLAFC|nr:A/G-specific adenine glycosylase [Plasmodium falciparum CAMP/Malaysia]EUR70245.1 A/G-specific adenine glycosylase [Plasmodium falciparum 7G8]